MIKRTSQKNAAEQRQTEPSVKQLLCKTATSAQLLEHITPLPLGEGLGVWLEGAGSVAALYNALSTCSLICSSSSFIFTTMFCISA